MHAGAVHQTTTFTSADRYPAIFDLAAVLRPDASRILSFGCSTGEELLTLRQRFAGAEIVGVELNPRCRALAKRRVAADARIRVIPPKALTGSFDIICAMAVFQREPHKITELDVNDLTAIYPFAHFEATLGDLVGRLRSGGLLCIDNAQYRVEDSPSAKTLTPVSKSPAMHCAYFGPDGHRLRKVRASTIFQKR